MDLLPVISLTELQCIALRPWATSLEVTALGTPLLTIRDCEPRARDALVVADRLVIVPSSPSFPINSVKYQLINYSNRTFSNWIP